MPPPPDLQSLIQTVLIDASSDDSLEQLRQAAQTVGEIEDLNDALLGHFVQRCRAQGRSWSEISSVFGVSKQAAHKRFTAPVVTPAVTFERFTDRARGVLRDAHTQARAFGHRFVGTEHLLLALFEPAEAIAAQVLREAEILRTSVEEMIVAQSERGSTPVAGEVPFTPRALDVLRYSVEEALKLGHNYIGTEHLLLALYDDAEGQAAKMLRSLGATYDDTKVRILAKFADLKR